MRTTSTGAGTRVNLVDVLTVEGNAYYWSDRTIAAPAVLVPVNGSALVSYQPWLMAAPGIKRSRAINAETGTLRLQNITGNTVARDFETILRRSAMEGAICVYRWWNAAAEVADLEFHARVSVSDVSTTDATLQLSDIYDFAGTEAPAMQYSETCQLVWAEKRCGADPTGTECKYSLQTCQVQERFVGITNTFFEKNYAEAIAAVPQTVVNRRRRI